MSLWYSTLVPVEADGESVMAKCVFRSNVTARFGIVTAHFGAT